MRVLGTLAVTHSSRRVNLARCSVQFLTSRFGDPERLANLPPFDSLPPPETLYSGALSLYRVVLDDRGRYDLAPLGHLKDREKIQHAAFLDATDLLVGYERRVERWRLSAPIDRLGRFSRANATLVGRFEHPHLADLHTVAPLADGRVALACSAADAVLLWEPLTGAVETLRMPAALYGHNYTLTAETDLRSHAIGDPQQTTHVNAAHPAGPGQLVVSTLIQGAIGVFDLAGHPPGYRELVSGFVGCHGARRSAEGEIYFADSTAGMLLFLDDQGGIARRFAVPSRWLHDVQQIAGSVYAFAVSDHNDVRLYDIESGELLVRRRSFTWPVERLFPVARALPFWLGNTTQALSFLPA
ncbi:MAG TPA: hypothetical protein VGE98_06755 [Thermoanaerobaculia bacterium]